MENNPNEKSLNINEEVNISQTNIDTNVKMKKNFVIPLVVIIGLLLILVALGCYKLFASSNPRNTYITIIDNLVAAFNENVDSGSEILNKPVSYSYGIDFDLKTTNNEMVQITNILNKIKVDANVELDYSAKKSNVNLDIKYNDGTLINADVIALNNDLYINEESLYDKLIKVSAEGFEEIWNANDTESNKIIINNLAEILKNNLKEEYFETEKTTIEINGEKVKTVKHSLSLDGEDIYDIEKGMLTDILKDKELLEELAKASSYTVEELEDTIKTTKKELVVDNEIEIEVDTYLNKRNMDVEKVVLDGSEYDIVFEKIAENEYQIKEVDDKVVNVGTLKINEKSFELTYDYENIKININIKEEENNNKVELLLQNENDEISFVYDENNGNGKGSIKIKSTQEQIDFTINISSKKNDIEEVTIKDTSNAILIDNISEEDTNAIMMELYQNPAFISLFQDLNAINNANTLVTN